MAAGDRRPRLGNAELQYYTGDTGNAALDGAGHLAITVRRADPELAAARYDGCRYTSARLITKDLRSFGYGLIEASVKVPGGRGVRPACICGVPVRTSTGPATPAAAT